MDGKAGTLSDESSNEMYTNASSKQLQNGEIKEPSDEENQKHEQVETTVKAEIDCDQWIFLGFDCWLVYLFMENYDFYLILFKMNLSDKTKLS